MGLLVGHGSCIMGHGSLSAWVTGSWVNASDPLPALSVTMATKDFRPGDILQERHFGLNIPKIQRRQYVLVTRVLKAVILMLWNVLIVANFT